MNTTTDSVQPSNCSGVMPEFGRAPDVQRLYGIKKGTLYNLIRDGKVRSVLVRVRGQKSGLRLIHLQSVRDFLFAELNAAATVVANKGE